MIVNSDQRMAQEKIQQFYRDAEQARLLRKISTPKLSMVQQVLSRLKLRRLVVRGV